jgi:branched-chain amino acid transport system substrate-binding protein
VNGHQLKLVVEDDTTSVGGNQTAASVLISKGVFGVIDESGLAFGAAKVLQQAGIPVTGGGYDGPEWFAQPNTNMFSIAGPADPKTPQYSTIADFVKSQGGKNCGSVGYSFPSSSASASGFVFACKAVGLDGGFLSKSLAFGSVAVTPLSLEIRSAGVDSMWLPLDNNTNFAILTALKQAGVNLKVAISATGYGQQLLSDSSAVHDAQGTWFSVEGVPVELKTSATKAFQAALAKYANFTGEPGFAQYEGWGGADLMITGLKLAGKNPTRSGFINGLHTVTSYDVGGLESPVNLTLSQFGKAPTSQCTYVVKLEGDSFMTPTKICGQLLPGSDQIP